MMEERNKSKEVRGWEGEGLVSERGINNSERRVMMVEVRMFRKVRWKEREGRGR